MATASDRAAVTVETLSLEVVRELAEHHPAPCLSVYLPTHRNVPDNRVDRPSFRHLVSALEMALSTAHRREEIERLLRPFRLLADDQRFWEHTRDGLAVLASDGAAQVFLLQRPVRPLALVTKRFHLMPLLRIAAALERFNLLALTSREARVFEGTSWHGAAGRPSARATIDRLDPVPLPAASGSVATEGRLVRDDVIDEEILQPHRVKLGKGPAGMAAGAVVHGGFGSKQDEVDKDTEIFLRHVDEVVHREVSEPSGLPLLLVADGRLAATFRGLSKNPLLHPEHVATDPHLLSAADLAAAGADVVARAREARIAREVAAFGVARDRALASGDPADIGRAAVAGRVATLFVEADRFEPLAFDRETGAIGTAGGLPPGFGAPPADLSRSGGVAIQEEDIYGSLAETVLVKGGTIVALARNAMPTETGLAAIYRY
jgi:hypothetical protein